MMRKLVIVFHILAGLAMVVIALAQNHIIQLPDAIDPFGQPDLTKANVWPYSARLSQLESNPAACSIALAHVGMNSTLLPTMTEGPFCRKQATVALSKLQTAKLRPEQTRCAIAARLWVWEHFSLQPAAQARFGQGVREITHYGSYSCRKIHNSNSMSEHSTANALDISGVVLKSGQAITVKRNYNDGAETGAFLHDIHTGLCQVFNLTLSPDYNADHQDHFHVDMGRVRDCR